MMKQTKLPVELQDEIRKSAEKGYTLKSVSTKFDNDAFILAQFEKPSNSKKFAKVKKNVVCFEGKVSIMWRKMANERKAS